MEHQPVAPDGFAEACGVCPFSTRAADSAFAGVCTHRAVRSARTGTVVAAEGAPVEAAFVVRRGLLKLYHTDAAGREHVLAIAGPGEFVGCEAEVGSPQPATVAAAALTEVCALPAAALQRARETSPAACAAVLTHLSHQLRDARAARVWLGTVSATARVALWLIHRMTDAGDGRRAARKIALADVAGMTGLAPETACRALGRLRRAGCVETRADRWLIVDEARLRGFAGSTGARA